MTADGGIWQKFVKTNLAPYGVFQRLENAVGVGAGDVMYCVRDDLIGHAGDLHGHSGFIELKLTSGAEDRRTITLQRNQIPWHAERARIAPSDYWFLCYDDRTTDIILIRGAELLRMPMRHIGDRHNEVTLNMGLVKYYERREAFNWSRLASHLAHR